MIKGVIFDYNRTIYDPGKGNLSDGALEVLLGLNKDGIPPKETLKDLEMEFVIPTLTRKLGALK